MRKWLKLLFAFSIALVLNWALSSTVSAENEMRDLHIQVELQEDGSAIVTEYRQMYMDTGTELYITMDNLGDTELLDFSVEGFTENPNWDSDDSQEEKTGQYGILDTNSGIELIWGIGNYGENTYQVSYTLSNLVRDLEDGQGMQWNFDTFSDIPAQNLTVEISSFEPLTQETVNFWGFGFEGDMQLEGDRIVWESFGEVDGDVIVLTQFPADTFNAWLTEDMTLSEQQDQAMDGSSYNDGGNTGFIIFSIIAGAFLLLSGTIFIVLRKISKARKDAGDMQPLHKRIKENKGITYDSIPFSGTDYAGLGVLLTRLHLGYFEDVFQAYLLKWSVEERIQIEAEEEKKFFGTNYLTTITVNHFEDELADHPITFSEIVDQIDKEEYTGTYEKGLWTMLLDAADHHGVITDEEIQTWGKKYADEVSTFADYLLDYSEEYLEEHHLFEFKEIKIFGVKQQIIVPSNEGETLANQLIQFDNYLNEVEIEDFVDDSRPLSFKDIMLWNVLLGRSDEVNKKLENIVPSNQYEDDWVYHHYWYGTYYTRTNWSKGLASGGFHSSSSSATSSSGGGGTTSVGGGGGAGGGGGGGAR